MGLETDQKCSRRDYCFYHKCVKVILPSPQNETMLIHKTQVISAFSYDTFYLQAKLSPLKIALVEIKLPNL